MIDEESLCCMCGTDKLIGIVNAGKKYYCNACMKKINDSGNGLLERMYHGWILWR